MFLNGKHEKYYNAKMLRDYTIEAMPVDSQILQGRNRTAFNLITQTFGLKEINFTMFFFGADRHEVLQNKTFFDKDCWGTVEILLPDGYFYRSVLQSAGTLTFVGDGGGTAEYTFTGMQHGPLVTASGLTIFCTSSAPYTDVILSGTLTATEGNLGGAAFSNLVIGNQIVIDGINKRLLYENAPYAQGFQFQTFPQLVPGWNTITAEGVDNVQIQYYPIFW